MKGIDSLKEKFGDKSSLLTVVGVLVVEIVFFSFGNPNFLKINNFLSIGLYAAIVGCISCSVTFINISGMIDISVGSQIAVVGMVAALVSLKGNHWLVVVLAALFAGMLCGALNGFFITVLKLNAFITSIATMQMLRGVAYLVSDGMSITITDTAYKFIGRGYVGGIPMSLLIMAISFIVFHLISKYTVFGRNIYLIGGNLNGLMAGVSGILMSAQTGAGIPAAAANYNMTALSAVILGGAALTGGKGTIFGTFLGSMVIAVLQNGMTMNSVGSYWQDIIIGAVLVVSISIDAIKGGSLKRKL